MTKIKRSKIEHKDENKPENERVNENKPENDSEDKESFIQASESVPEAKYFVGQVVMVVDVCSLPVRASAKGRGTLGSARGANPVKITSVLPPLGHNPL